MVTGFIGENTTITCYYRAKGKLDWCKLGRTCIKDGLIDGITVNTDEKKDSFSVTMSGLRGEHSGWYYCVNGDLQMPIYLTVTIRPTVESTTVTAATESATVEDQKEDQKTKEDRTFPALLSLIIPLVSLILVAIVALLVLFRTKRAKIQDSSGSSNLKEGEVTYSEVSFKKNQALPVESDGDVTYSSVVIKKPQGGKRAKAKDDNVTHSHHKQNV
ncbi:CMRF35-like molecule 1 [Cyprinodon tularosa]|uniref:CMRF35-like molecule 1 n=1 Tax=Cyprinodon tularosa TaxID=77115 RepID=UPI0018E1FC80|nr:CMRF35-like molecule 1 [Cyprinodon tularosa]